MTRSASFRLRSTAAVFTAALLLAACGSSDGSDAESADPTTTTATAEKTTTTEATDPTTPDAPDGPTADELEALLPTVDEVGEGWVDDPDEQNADAAIEVATEAQCPSAAGLLAPAEEGEPTAAFENDLGQTLRVTFSPDADPIDDDDLQALIDEINGCDPVTAEDGGFTFTASFEAAVNEEHGDQGVQIAAAVTIADGTDTYEVNKYRLLFLEGTVGTTISGGDGLLDDGTVNPIDGNGLEAVATEMAKRVAAL
jgi:hypothetical protein